MTNSNRNAPLAEPAQWSFHSARYPAQLDRSQRVGQLAQAQHRHPRSSLRPPASLADLRQEALRQHRQVVGAAVNALHQRAAVLVGKLGLQVAPSIGAVDVIDLEVQKLADEVIGLAARLGPAWPSPLHAQHLPLQLGELGLLAPPPSRLMLCIGRHADLLPYVRVPLT